MAEDFFEKFNLKATRGEVEEGEQYPLYGIVTGFIEEDPNKLSLVLNYNIKLNLVGDIGLERLNLLRSRAFEPGVFVSTITKKDLTIPDPSPDKLSKDTPFPIEATCSTIVYGKSPTMEMN